MLQPGIEPATFRAQVQHPNHYTTKPDDDYVLPHQCLWTFDILVCPLARVKAGCVHLCRVAGNTVWSRMASDTHISEMTCSGELYRLNFNFLASPHGPQSMGSLLIFFTVNKMWTLIHIYTYVSTVGGMRSLSVKLTLSIYITITQPIADAAISFMLSYIKI